MNKAILHYYLLLLSFLIGLSTNCIAQKKPNILWINADDLGIELGCYGNQDVHSPHINKMASNGVLYSKSYATAPVCSSSRSSMITGMYPSTINALNHRTIDKQPLPDGIVPITTLMRKAGYFCTNGNAHNQKKNGKEDFNFIAENLFDGTNWSQRAKDQPFFAQIQIHEPHRPFIKKSSRPINPKNVTLPASYPNHPLLKADWAKYLESVQACDQMVGIILKKLEDDGLLDNTIIFFFGDNGRPHLRDKQFLYEGGLQVPLIIINPFDTKKKGREDHQLVSLIDVTATTLSFANIKLPTTLHGNAFLGKNAKKRKYVFGFRQRTGDAPDDMRSITDGKYKLIWNKMPNTPWMQLSSYKKLQYPAFSLYYHLWENKKLEEPYSNFMKRTKPIIELYNLEKDPYELVNLAEQKTNIANKLFVTLKDSINIYEANMVIESEKTIQKAKESSMRYYKKNIEKKGLNTESNYIEIIKYWNEFYQLK